MDERPIAAVHTRAEVTHMLTVAIVSIFLLALLATLLI
jgi:hypothetical protein